MSLRGPEQEGSLEQSRDQTEAGQMALSATNSCEHPCILAAHLLGGGLRGGQGPLVNILSWKIAQLSVLEASFWFLGHSLGPRDGNGIVTVVKVWEANLGKLFECLHRAMRLVIHS